MKQSNPNLDHDDSCIQQAIELERVLGVPKTDRFKWVDWRHIDTMCEEYPALAKAYKNFKTIYTMVEQDWKGQNK